MVEQQRSDPTTPCQCPTTFARNRDKNGDRQIKGNLGRQDMNSKEPRHDPITYDWVVATSKARLLNTLLVLGLMRLMGLVDFSQPLRSPLCIWGFSDACLSIRREQVII